MREWTVNKNKIALIKGNIALIESDAIVNAANKSLILGGGVAGAIRQLGGSSIQDECNKIGTIEAGEAVITKGGNLKAKYVIHAVGPVYGEGDEDLKLANATISSLKIAKKKKFQEIVFPAISTGIFHFPMERCSKIMLETSMNFIKQNDYPQNVIFCLFGEMALSVFEKSLKKLAATK